MSEYSLTDIRHAIIDKSYTTESEIVSVIDYIKKRNK
jgi:hypothetical protein